MDAWHQAWTAAQPSVSSLKQQCEKFLQAAPRTQRVAQIDAELLDEELLQILFQPIAKALNLINSVYAAFYEPEYFLIVRLLIYKLSIWDLGATYGAKLQNLRYKASKTSAAEKMTPSGIPRRALWLHGMITILGPYLYRRLRVYALSHAWPDAPSKDARRKFWESLTRLETVYDALSVVSFIAFLYNGKYRTIADRLLRLRLVPAQRATSRQVSYEFMNRQMVWHAFTEFLIFLFPLINTRLLRRRLSQLNERVISWTKKALYINITHSNDKRPRNGQYFHFPENQCAICIENAGFLSSMPFRSVYPNSHSIVSATPEARDVSKYPLHTPYITSCLHKYCYVCIADRLLRAVDDGETSWECLRCGSAVLSAERVTSISDKDSIADADDVCSDGTDFLTSTDLNI